VPIGQSGRLHNMEKLLVMVGMTVGGYVGWIAGKPIGMFTAFTLSMVGTGAGIYVARRFSAHWLT